MNGLELSKKIAGYLDNKKAKDIKILKIDDLTVVTDYIVIATGSSTTQVKSLADEVDFMVDKQLGIKPARVEGYESKNWILIDYENVIVHVFHPQAREYYSLDKLWADGTEIEFELEEPEE
ncbi:MAG: ribosome silencing factor [Oscillospiraceae bacterium]|nr:ribosome silencing factor [Oscillospiraceae bacterium]MBQ7816078.1 ribosome silencing factor [Oscillospiraceae bacterium]